MTALVCVLCGALGLVVGSFLNVVVWRVPRGESVVRPPSHCPGCDAPVRPRDNVPVVSWLLLRGRCRDCGVRISARYPLVESLTGATFAALAERIGPHPALPAYLYLAAVGIALALIDLETLRLPDVLTLPSYAVGAALLGVAAVAGHDAWPLVRALIGMATLYTAFLAVALAVPAGMGFGDVKLAGVLGLYTGFLGWGTLVVGVVAAFALGGVVGAVLLALGAGRKAKVPFGPWMVLGALVAILAAAPVVSGYRHVTGV